MDNCIKYKDYQYKALKRPATLPLSLTEVKAFLKVTTSTEDDLISTMINSVVNYAESYTHIEFITKQFRTFRDCFYFPIEIRKSKLVQIDSIKYFDENKILQTFSSSNYYSDFNNFYSKIYLDDDANTSSITLSSRYDNVQIDFWAGFGVAIASLSGSGTTVTITTSDNHYFSTGDTINISYASNIEFNGNYKITVTGDKTFTYANTKTASETASNVFARFIPSDLKLAIFNHINRVYMNRGDCEAGNKSACDCSSAMNLPAETLQIYNMYRILEIDV
jgi:uncharacterized phiE125 gp8 family phage protein